MTGILYQGMSIYILTHIMIYGSFPITIKGNLSYCIFISTLIYFSALISTSIIKILNVPWKHMIKIKLWCYYDVSCQSAIKKHYLFLLLPFLFFPVSLFILVSVKRTWQTFIPINHLCSGSLNGETNII